MRPLVEKKMSLTANLAKLFVKLQNFLGRAALLIIFLSAGTHVLADEILPLEISSNSYNAGYFYGCLAKFETYEKLTNKAALAVGTQSEAQGFSLENLTRLDVTRLKSDLEIALNNLLVPQDGAIQVTTSQLWEMSEKTAEWDYDPPFGGGYHADWLFAASCIAALYQWNLPSLYAKE